MEKLTPQNNNQPEKYLEDKVKEFNLKITDFSNENFENNKESIEKLLDKLTNGKFSDKSYGNHVLNALNKETQNQEFFTQNDTERQKYILDEEIKLSSAFFMSFGHSEWIDKNTNLVIFLSQKNPNFKKIVQLRLAELMDLDIENVPLEKISDENLISLTTEEGTASLEGLQKQIEKAGGVDIRGGNFYGFPNPSGYIDVQVPNVNFEPKFLVALLKSYPIIDNGSHGAYIYNFGAVSEVFEKRFNKKLSFGSFADTIVDLKSKKMYEYEPKK